MRKIWCAEETEKFKILYSDTYNKEIAEIFGVSVLAIKSRAKFLNLKKSAEHLVRVNKDSIGIHRSPLTQFTKGSKPINTKFNNCITLRIYKGRPYKFIRLEENKWIHLHRFIYKKYHGYLPQDMVIIFKDCNSMNLNIDNLIPISRQELMIRNSIHRPKDNHELYLYLTNALNFRNKYKELRAKRRAENEEQRKIRIAEYKELRAKRRAENEEQRKIRIAKLKKRRSEINQRKLFEIKERSINKKIFGRSRRISTEFITSKSSENFLMEMGKRHFGLAIQFTRDKDIAKDAIMNVLCFFIEGNIEVTNDEFKNRLTYECKLIMKDSYKKISFHDIEYKLSNVSELSDIEL